MLMQGLTGDSAARYRENGTRRCSRLTPGQPCPSFQGRMNDGTTAGPVLENLGGVQRHALVQETAVNELGLRLASLRPARLHALELPPGSFLGRCLTGIGGRGEKFGL